MPFLHLEQDESVVLALRRHWTVLAGHVAVSALLAFIPLVVWMILPSYVPSLFTPPVRPLFISGVFFYLLFVWLGFFLRFLDYILDVWLITTKRVIDVEQHGLFHREVSEFRLERIQDVTVETRGIVETFLRFGNVHIQTAGDSRDFVFEQVPNPDDAKEILLRESARVTTAPSRPPFPGSPIDSAAL